ncbi:hypothetical protein ACQY0O_005775 [Thecaphora frezii]
MSGSAAKGKARQLDDDAIADPPSSPLLLLASATIAGHSRCLGNLQWSGNGQALITLKQCLAILTPCLGLHPQLLDAHRLPDLEAHPRYWDKFDHLVQQIDYRSFYDADPTVHTRSAIAKDYSAIHPAVIEHGWRRAYWSPPGLGVSGSSLVLALGHEFDLHVLGASKNPFTADWKLVAAVDLKPVQRHVHDKEQPSQCPDEEPRGLRVLPVELAAQRKEGRALQVLDALWTEAIPDNLAGSSAATDGQVVSLIAAGTRSGHLALWSCSTHALKPRFLGCRKVGLWDVHKLCASAWTRRDRDGPAICRIATQDRERVAIWDIHHSFDHLRIEPSAAQPPPLPGRMISTWHWIGNILVYASTGEVRLFDADSGRSRTLTLDDGGRDECDPLQPAACIQSLDGNSCTVTLQDATCYRIPLELTGGDKARLRPLPIQDVHGYRPVLENVQKQYDALQRLHGSATEPSSTSPANALMATLRSYEPVSSMGATLSGSSRYNLLLRSAPELPPDASARAEALLSAALESGDHADVSTVARVRHVLAHYQASEDKDAFANGLVRLVQRTSEDVKGALLAMDSGGAAASIGCRDDALRRSQTCLYMAQWLLREHPDVAAEASEIAVRLRLLLFVRHLGEGMEVLLDEVEPAKSLGADEVRADMETCTRLAAAAYLLTKQQGAVQPLATGAWLARVLQSAEKIFKRLGAPFDEAKLGWDASLRIQGSLETSEECAACQAKLSLKVDAAKGTVEWTSCSSGHIWPRCDVTLAPLVSVNVRACTGCWAKSLLYSVPAAPDAMDVDGGEGNDDDDDGTEAVATEPGTEPLSYVLLHRSRMCWACGCDWIHL